MSIFKDHIDRMSAYKPPLDGRDPKQHLLLDFNERTLPVGEAIRQALVDYINDDRLQMYPSYGDIVEKIAAYAKVSAEQVMITNGSDQGIDLIFRAACCEGDEAIIPGPSFAMYSQCARVENLTIIEPQYTQEKGYPLAEVLAAISGKTRIIVVSNPNNPCGTLVARNDICTLAKAASDAVILVDECYFEYSSVTVADLVQQYPNIVITRTFSKTWGLPSLRLGYVIADADNIRALLNVRGPYDINQLAVVAIRAGLENLNGIESYVYEVMSESKPMLEGFFDQQKIPYWRSGGNYLWAFFENPEQIERGLQEAGVLVRPKSYLGQVGLRITLGTKEQSERLISVLAQLI
ncbi:pyridoxal phosphate-dependent aminotransferase [Teredinibacter haidensis]|uniref:pyridoxal phosphate-dependent aminotransferase n=1 Tax=Teredinibacter haidensis TaxID=2731755 RepID=UPI000948A222|nr:aminotransferase class I/II-fold pyridoxal phosphate-dependent enzyme [Teredinibacter haidensis]